ncbi:hypothetical protein Efla_006898 [Eimeria flavescens]
MNSLPLRSWRGKAFRVVRRVIGQTGQLVACDEAGKTQLSTEAPPQDPPLFEQEAADDLWSLTANLTRSRPRVVCSPLSWSSVDTADLEEMLTPAAAAESDGEGVMKLKSFRNEGRARKEEEETDTEDNTWTWTSLESAECINSLPFIEVTEATSGQGHLIARAQPARALSCENAVSPSLNCRGWSEGSSFPFKAAALRQVTLQHGIRSPIQTRLLAHVLAAAGGSHAE